MLTTPRQTLEEIAALSRRDLVLISSRAREVTAREATAEKVAALVDTTRALVASGVAHALIGEVAVGIHSGLPRATADTNIAVASSVDRVNLIRILEDAGLSLVGDFPHSINFRHRSGEPVQLALDPAFDPMIARAEHFDVEGVAIPIVQKRDLIAMKERAAADPERRRSKALRDQADVELLRGDVPDPDEGW